MDLIINSTSTLELLPDAFYIILIAILGLVVGSFLNVVIYRLPNKMSLSKPRSHCPHCNYQLKWYDNIPIFSYLFLGGKCRNCHTKISPQYIIVEVLTSCMWILVYLMFGKSVLTILSILVISIYIVLSAIDIEHMIIPDVFPILIAIIGIISMFTSPINYNDGEISITYQDKLLSLVFALVMILLIMVIEKLSKKEIIGGGDVKLIIATGLFMGWQLTILGLFLGALIACFIEIPIKMINTKRTGKKDNVLPFGPFLASGFAISLLFGLNLISWYTSIALI